MLKIRLTRRGKRNRPFFRIVVAEATAPIKGRFIEILGYVDPLAKKRNLKKERVLYWLKQGAQPSATVHNLLVAEGIIKGVKISKFVAPKKKKPATVEAAAKEEAQPKETGIKKEEETKEKAEKPTPPKATPVPVEQAKKAKAPQGKIAAKKAPAAKPASTEEKVKPLPTEASEKPTA